MHMYLYFCRLEDTNICTKFLHSNTRMAMPRFAYWPQDTTVYSYTTIYMPTNLPRESKEPFLGTWRSGSVV